MLTSHSQKRLQTTNGQAATMTDKIQMSKRVLRQNYLRSNCNLNQIFKMLHRHAAVCDVIKILIIFETIIAVSNK